MDDELEQAFSENKMTDERARELLRESISSIVKYCKEKDFYRWLQKRDLPKKIREAIIEEFNEEDKQRYPNWSGYHITGTSKSKINSFASIEGTSQTPENVARNITNIAR